MTGIALDIPSGSTAFELAEWVEGMLLISMQDSISRSAILAHFPAGQSPDSAEFGELLIEIERRSKVAPDVYPFRVSQESIVRVEADLDAAYELLVLLSMSESPFRLSSQYNLANSHFEFIIREALLHLGGPGAKCKRFGWPNDDGRPEHFPEAVEWIAEQMGLSCYNPKLIADDDDKDGGVDLVSWRPFADQSPSFPVWLTQCTVQAAFENKAKDIVGNRWMRMIDFGTPPAVVLSVPFAIPPEAKVRTTVNFTADIFLDRMRIAHCINPRPMMKLEPEYEALEIWVGKERAALVSMFDETADPSGPKPRLPKPKRPMRFNKSRGMP